MLQLYQYILSYMYNYTLMSVSEQNKQQISEFSVDFLVYQSKISNRHEFSVDFLSKKISLSSEDAYNFQEL